MALLTYTVTNVGLLCCLAALAGSIAGVTIEVEPSAGSEGQDERESPKGNVAEILLAGVLRSFLVYLLFLAGVYVAANAPFENPTSEQYARIAGTISTFSFLVGYNPVLFQKITSIMFEPRSGR
jgi:hypothetical protein